MQGIVVRASEYRNRSDREAATRSIRSSLQSPIPPRTPSIGHHWHPIKLGSSRSRCETENVEAKSVQGPRSNVISKDGSGVTVPRGQ